jgi:hypothetical protein
MLINNPEYQPRYAVGTFTHSTGSQPDTVRVRLYDPTLLPALKHYLQSDGLGALRVSDHESRFAEYTLHRPQDAGDIAAQIRLILWYAAYGDVMGNYPANAR